MATPIKASQAGGGHGGPWTEQEKVALLVSVIKKSGYKPSWQDIGVPQTRTLRSSKETFSKLMKSAHEVPLVKGSDVRTPTPRKRKRNTDDAVGDSDDDSEFTFGSTESPLRRTASAVKTTPAKKKCKMTSGRNSTEDKGAANVDRIDKHNMKSNKGAIAAGKDGTKSV